MKIKFSDLYLQNNLDKKKFLKTFEKIINNSSFIEGKYVKRFEQAFAAFCGKKYGIGVNSGTDALMLSLLANGIKPGDEVITVPNSYFSTTMVISRIGAIPVFVDIHPAYYTLDAEKLEKAINKKTKAIIPVHMFGQPAEIDKILRIAKKHGLTVIEDVSHAHGARYKGKILPYGETGAFSLYPGKNLGSLGEAGIVVTNNKKVAEKLLLLRNDGSIEKYKHEMLGFKSRLDAIQAAILQIKLSRLTKWNEERRKLANLYFDELKNIKEVVLPKEHPDSLHVFHLFVIEVEQRDKLKQYLSEKGIQTNIHYPIPIHFQKPYKHLFKKGSFPITEEKAKKILSLPIFPGLKKTEVIYICNMMLRFLR